MACVLTLYHTNLTLTNSRNKTSENIVKKNKMLVTAFSSFPMTFSTLFERNFSF